MGVQELPFTPLSGLLVLELSACTAMRNSELLAVASRGSRVRCCQMLALVLSDRDLWDADIVGLCISELRFTVSEDQT